MPSPPNQLRKMKALATGLLIFMLLLWLVTRHLLFPGVEWIHAFAEAAMVGAFADWFAVTALFRHPLGIPIPHTAIVPNQQKKIAAGLGSFLQGNFLSPEILSKEWNDRKVLRQSLLWLREEKNSLQTARVISQAIPTILSQIDFRDNIPSLVKNSLRKAAKAPLAPTLIHLLERFHADPEHRRLIAALLGRFANVVNQNKDRVIQEAREGAPLKDRKIIGKITQAVASNFSTQAVDRLEAQFLDASVDLNHPLHEKIDAAIISQAQQWRTDGTIQPAWRKLYEMVLNDPQTEAFLSQFLANSSLNLIENLQKPDSPIHLMLQKRLQTWVEKLESQPETLAWLETSSERWITQIAIHHGPTFQKLVENTVNAWDPSTLTQKLEQQIGPDLQFIRINGTTIGGLIGLLIHSAEKLLP